MTDRTLDPAAPGRHSKPVWQELREAAAIALAVLAFLLLLVGAVAFFASLIPPPD